MSIARDFPDLPPVWAAGAALAQWALGAALPLVRLGPWAGPSGWAAIAAGLALILWSAAWFRRRGTTIEPNETPSTLIVEGPFRIDRHPIYTGMAVCLVGTGLLSGGLERAAAGAGLRRGDRRSARTGGGGGARAAFGPEAERYIAATRRW